MALTVEDGTGVSAADAFLSVDEATTYHTGQGNGDWTGDAEAMEQAIRRASRYVSHKINWPGHRVRGREQGLAWPRYGVCDPEGDTVASDAVPREVKQAVAEVALRELVDPGSMNPDFVPGERVVDATVGPISASFDRSATGPESVIPVLTVVREILAPLIGTGHGSALSGPTRRT